MEAIEHLHLFLRSDNSAKIVSNLIDVNTKSNDYAYIGHAVTTPAFCSSEALCHSLQNVNIPIFSAHFLMV
jgi:hypothetical protein